MTITVTPHAETSPPKVSLAVSVPAGGVMQSVDVYRLVDGIRESLRKQPTTGFDAQPVDDYEMPYEEAVTYGWEVDYLAGDAFTTEKNEAWPNLASWTAVNGAGGSWAVSGGTLTYTGPISALAKITYTLASARYRITFAAPPKGLTAIDFGGFQIDVANSRIIAGNVSKAFSPGTGTWVLSVTPTSVSLTTTAGTYSLDAVVLVTKVEFQGPLVRVTIDPAPMTTGAAWTPLSAATDSTGRLFILGLKYVGSTPTNRVFIFDSSNTFVTAIDLPAGAANGQITGIAAALAVDAAGRLIISDADASRLQRFTVSGTGGATALTYFDKVGSLGTGNGQFATGGVNGIAVDSAGNIYTIELNNARVQKFTSALAYAAQWGSYGAGDSQFTIPTAIASDGTSVYVVDAGRPDQKLLGRIRKFSAAGVFAWKATLNTTYNNRETLAVDAQGQVFVSALGSSIDIYSGSTGAVAQTVPAPATAYQGIRAMAMNPAKTRLYVAERTGAYQIEAIDLAAAVVDDVLIEGYGGLRTLAETAAPVTVSPSSAWLVHPARPVLSVSLARETADTAGLAALGSIRNPSTATVHEIVGTDLPVVITSGPRGSDRLMAEITTATRSEELALKELLRDQVPILFRFTPSWGVDFADGFYSVGDSDRERYAQMTGLGLRRHRLPLTAVDSPAVTVEAVGWSWASLAAEFATWEDVAAAFATWADLLANVRRPGF